MNEKMGIAKAGNVSVKIIRNVETMENNKILDREAKKIMKRVSKIKVRTADNPTLKPAQERENWHILYNGIFVEEYYNYKDLPNDANVVSSM